MDWLDIALHVAGAALIMALGWWVGYSLAALIINSALWPAREFWQKFNGDEDYFFDLWGALGAIFKRKQPFMEWACPVAVGGLIYWGL